MDGPSDFAWVIFIFVRTSLFARKFLNTARFLAKSARNTHKIARIVLQFAHIINFARIFS